MFQSHWNSGCYGRGYGRDGERGGPWSAGPGRGWGRGGGGGSWGGGRRPGPPDWLGDFFGPPPRAERGNVRYLILDALAAQPRHGYEVIQVIEERSRGSYRPSPGVVYPTLQLLEELKHARVIEQDARKVYTITDEGKLDLEAHRDEVKDFYERASDDGWEQHVEEFGELMRRAARLFKTFRIASRRGRLSLAAQAKIRTVLDDAVKRIETILDEDAR